MSPELDKKLCDDYPKIFVNRHSSMGETAMCWGFSCGDGWYPLINKLCREIQWHLDKNAKKETEQFVADQVKEKFGTLRFYGHGGDETIHNFIWFAESMSGILCEECGAPGKLRGLGWIYTACDTHTKPEHLDLENDETL